MTETSGVAVLIAAISSFLLAAFGVDYYALLWASLGAATTLLYSKPTKKARAGIMTTVISAFAGAALGSLANEHLITTRSFLLVASLVGGAGAQPLVNALVLRAVSWIGKSAGNTVDPK
jgi:hypothetical protein